MRRRAFLGSPAFAGGEARGLAQLGLPQVAGLVSEPGEQLPDDVLLLLPMSSHRSSFSNAFAPASTST